jgi:hypothetical protein
MPVQNINGFEFCLVVDMLDCIVTRQGQYIQGTCRCYHASKSVLFSNKTHWFKNLEHLEQYNSTFF